MDVQDAISGARDVMTVQRVYGQPYEKNGLTVIPAAKVQGGAGGGGGEGPEGMGKGSGSGFGMNARPIGAYVIHGDDVEWRPAIDVTRLVIVGQVLAIVALLSIRSIVKALARPRGR